MIAAILSKLKIPGADGADLGLSGSLGGILNIFDVNTMIPSYFLQISIGIYIIEIIFILSSTLVIVDAGEDKLQKTYVTGKNLMRGLTLYFITALFAIVSLFLLASIVLGSAFG